MRLALATALALALGAGCAKKDKEPEPEPTGTGAPPPISDAEAERGRQACRDFAARVCDQAKGDPARQEDCELAQARPSAYELNLRAARAEGNATTEDKAAIIDGARKIAKKCFEDLATISGGGSIATPGAEAEAADDEPGGE